MQYDSNHHHRRSIRLQGYHYTQAGAYYVTIVAQHRLCLFGDVVAGQVRLNAAGRMVQTVWDALPTHYPGVGIDAFIIMPNHIHGIFLLTPPDPDTGPPRGIAPTHAPHADTVGAGPRACPDTGQPSDPGPPQGVAPTDEPDKAAPPLSAPDVVHRFKTLTTKLYTDGVKHHGWPPYPGRVWQRNYYEHIIRDDADLNRIRDYIAANPTLWDDDDENPTHPPALRTHP